MHGTTSCSVISLTVKKKTALPSKDMDCAILCNWATISLCLNYNSTIVGQPRVWWGEGDVSSSAVTFVLGGETMQMDRPTLTGLEQDVHFILKDFKQFSKPDERVLGARPQTAPMGGRSFSNCPLEICFCLGCYVQHSSDIILSNGTNQFGCIAKSVFLFVCFFA